MLLLARFRSPLYQSLIPEKQGPPEDEKRILPVQKL